MLHATSKSVPNRNPDSNTYNDTDLRVCHTHEHTTGWPDTNQYSLRCGLAHADAPMLHAAGQPNAHADWHVADADDDTDRHAHLCVCDTDQHAVGWTDSDQHSDWRGLADAHTRLLDTADHHRDPNRHGDGRYADDHLPWPGDGHATTNS